jgi:hypothetical protein
MVGEVFQQALRNKWIDQQAEFDIPRPKPKSKAEPVPEMQWPGAGEAFRGIVDRLRGIFGTESPCLPPCANAGTASTRAPVRSVKGVRRSGALVSTLAEA